MLSEDSAYIDLTPDTVRLNKMSKYLTHNEQRIINNTKVIILYKYRLCFSVA